MLKFWRGVVVLMFGMIMTGDAQAQFGTEPLELSPGEYHYSSELVADGEGGVYYVTRTGNAGVEMRIERIDPFGEMVFNLIHGPDNINSFSTDANTDGVVCAVAGDDDPRGLLFWLGPDGMQREETTITGYSSSIVSDPRVVALPDESGLPTAVVLYRDLEDDMVFVQKVNGIMELWGQGGYGLASASEVAEYTMIGDGYGGVIVAWTTPLDTAVRMQRISAAGSTVWAAGGVTAIDIGNLCSIEGLVTNGAGGAYIVARAVDLGDGRAFWQHVSNTGVRSNSTATWVPTYEGYSIHDEVCLASDGAGGFWVALFIEDSQEAVVRHRAAGSWTQTTVRGQLQAADRGSVSGNLALVSDPSGGALLTWGDGRSSLNDGTPPGLYGMMLDDAGNLLWREDGTLIDPAAAAFSVQLVAGVDRGCYALFNEYSYQNLLQSVDPAGYYGATPFVLDGVHDVPGDQGGQLVVAWQPSFLESISPADLERYTVWRLLEFSAGKALPGNLISDPAVAPAGDPAEGPMVWAQPAAEKTIYWELVATAEPLQRPAYAAVVASLADSTAVYGADEHFQVIAHHVDGTNYWTSNEAVGHSVDNLAPAMPAALAAALDWTHELTELTWQANTETDLLEYRVYRGVSSDFEPNLSSLVATVLEPGFIDDQADAGASYQVAAVDVHGNVSEFALLASSAASGVDLPLAAVSGLTAVAPNPFNPSTTVRFNLAADGPATLQVFDLSGRLVRSLAGGEYTAGEHAVTWDGRRDDGAVAASGMYFVHLRAGVREDVMKAMLLK